MAAAETPKFGRGFPTPGPQCPTGHKVMDQVFFLSESDFKDTLEKTDYDLVIVGTGFCGMAVAERALHNDPFCKILMLERGTFFLPDHFQNLPIPFVNTLGGLSETFPWTVSASTINGNNGALRCLLGMVPFFGGRSTIWSSWCPRPTVEEMHGWPQKIVDTIRQDYFQSAEDLLHVQRSDQVDSSDKKTLGISGHQGPVYGVMQDRISKILDEGATGVKDIYRQQSAPLASNSKHVNFIDFKKYAVPGELLKLASKQATAFKQNKGSMLHIATNCVVEKIHQQGGNATGLKTSRGVVPLGDAQLILAMGTLPPTTLVRNSFLDLKVVQAGLGERLSGHFLSVIIARVPREDLEGMAKFGDLEIGAFYIAGTVDGDYSKQFHIQMTVISDKDPESNEQKAFRYMPDVVVAASRAQLQTSKDHIILICAVVGELDANNADNWFRHNANDADETTNSMLQVKQNQRDMEAWDAMDEATFKLLETVVSPRGPSRVEYWHGPSDTGHWQSFRPGPATMPNGRRFDALIHESSTLYLGEDPTTPVDLDYKLRGTGNVYITGGSLWPRGGSWNPTMVMVAMAQHLADKLTLSQDKIKAKKIGLLAKL